MKTKFILIALLFLSATSHAQLLDKITLKDYGVLTNDVMKITEKSFDYDRNSASYKDPNIEIYTFDSNGYKTSFSLNNKVEYNKSFNYSDNYKKVTEIFISSTTKYFFDILKLPYGNVLLKADKYKIPKNTDGSIKKVSYVDDEGNLDYNFTYSGNIITSIPSAEGLNTTRATKEGFLLSEENQYLSLYYSYDTKTKLESQRVSVMKGMDAHVHYISLYEFDKKGNWIVRYDMTAVPLYGKKGNGIKSITIRELSYKDNSKAGYTEITQDMKSKASAIVSNIIVQSLDKNNFYATPLFLDYNLVELSKTNAITSNVKDSKCEGNCQNGWGKYTYDNGYYQGFWKNGLKEGYGIYKWNTNMIYSGSWVADKMSGYGSTTFSNGNGHDGSYLNGTYEGNGIYYIKETKTTEYNNYVGGKFNNAINLASTGLSVGCIKGDCTNGYGYFKFTNGDSFAGDFQNGKLKRGSYLFSNGDIYTGNFNSSNQFEGYGFYSFKASGDFYFGNWSNGKRNGNGYAESNKVSYKGEWKDGYFIKDLSKL
jgi:hypothetical protein